MLWQHGSIELERFVQHLNSRVETIRFTHEFSSDKVSFLDVSISNINGKLTTDLYTKPTDTHDYLLYSSAHPKNCKDSIPYSQFLRVRRICSDRKTFEKNVYELAIHFRRRKYPLELILDAAVKAGSKDRKSLLEPLERTGIGKDNDIFLISNDLYKIFTVLFSNTTLTECQHLIS